MSEKWDKVDKVYIAEPLKAPSVETEEIHF
jgi:hypothetical protein